MENVLRKRIKTRIEALGITSYGAAVQAGLNRYVVYDLLAGKKETIRQKAIIALAEALDCDPEYLTGTQAEIRRAPPPLPRVRMRAPSTTETPNGR